jgi:hypothetical protein
MKQDYEDRPRYTQCWIDSKHAKVGKFVQLLTLDEGKDFWEITSTGATSKTDPSIGYRTWSNDI